MARAHSSSLLGMGLAIISATCGCNSSSVLRRPPSTAPDRVAVLSTSPEPEPMELSFSFSSAESNEGVEEETDMTFGAEGRTIITVDEDTVRHSSGTLLFTPARRGQETVGVRVFFEIGEEDGDDETLLGLRRADRIEEIDGLTIAAVSRFLEAWQGVGNKPEVRLLINRAGRSHIVIYRRRFPGAARGI